MTLVADTAVDLARMQFATTSLYHFLFVPLTLGLGPIVAVFVLRLVRTVLTLLAVDPNATSIIEGTIMVAVVMLGAFLAMRGRS